MRGRGLVGSLRWRNRTALAVALVGGMLACAWELVGAEESAWQADARAVDALLDVDSRGSGGGGAEQAAKAEPSQVDAAQQLAQAKATIAAHRAREQAETDTDKGGLAQLFSAERKAPVVKPFAVGAFSGNTPDHTRGAEPLLLGRGLDADGLFSAVANCYPAVSHWSPELSVEGRASSGAVDSTGVAISDHYIGIVASMPLWSSSEKTRERDRELMRRQQAADLVGALGEAMAARGQALREYGLYRALESRSALRVSQGLADTSEQVSYLDAVAKAHGGAVTAHAKIERTRLALVSQCRPDARRGIDSYIKRVTQLEEGL